MSLDALPCTSREKKFFLWRDSPNSLTRQRKFFDAFLPPISEISKNICHSCNKGDNILWNNTFRLQMSEILLPYLQRKKMQPQASPHTCGSVGTRDLLRISSTPHSGSNDRRLQMICNNISLYSNKLQSVCRNGSNFKKKYPNQLQEQQTTKNKCCLICYLIRND